MGTTLLDWYYDYYIEIEAYDAINAHYTRVLIIGFALCFFVTGLVLYLNEAFFIGILNTLCDPEKYVKAELIRCKKSFLRRLSRRNKMNIGVGYHAMEDYENAWKYYEGLIPANPYSCRNKVLLCRLVSFFHDIGDDEKASVYKSRLEQLRTPGRSGLLVELTLDGISIDDAIKDQRYEEAKNLIAKYIKSSSVATYTKTIYHYYLGLIAYETDDISEAIYRFRTALETGEKLPFAEDARLKLNEIGPI
jgi:tetratricopeptide (TPR) repeat protein